ncbi:MAG: leucine-rich repeat domain-containing protein [Bacteroidales bacterium]|nr:leucine-rich repeat domain-containing protein [Bacteroidales bacterium]
MTTHSIYGFEKLAWPGSSLAYQFKRVTRGAALAAMFIAAVTAKASEQFTYTYEGSTLTYETIDEGTCMVTGYQEPLSKALQIPSKANNYDVVAIYERAFYNCDDLTSVTIPNSVKSVGKSAFEYCNGLKKAEFASIEALCNIQFDNEFSNPLGYAHRLYIDGKEVIKIEIPESVSAIGNSTFQGCSELISVTIPASVTSIGDYAFYYCTGLSSAIIPNSVTAVGDWAYTGCTGLTSVAIPESVTDIGDYAFHGCSSITALAIPDAITCIGDWTFGDCRGLTSLIIPDSVISIGEGAFAGCSGLTSVLIPDSVTAIGESAFNGCLRLESVTIPNSITSISDWTFIGCESLISVTIPESVTYIGTYAFSGCSQLPEVTIPNSVTYIGTYAFYRCTNLSSVYYGADTLVEGAPNIFPDEAYEVATLYLSAEGMKSYADIAPWKNFKNIREHNFSGIDDVIADFDAEKPYEVFKLNGISAGTSTTGLTPGIYIIRQGRLAKKISVK